MTLETINKWIGENVVASTTKLATVTFRSRGLKSLAAAVASLQEKLGRRDVTIVATQNGNQITLLGCAADG